MKLIQTAMAAGALLLAAPNSFADDAHHPDEPAPAAPAVNAPQQAKPGGTASGGMMSPDMMKMMMDMMASGSGQAMGQSGSMGPMMAPEYTEGRLAFLKVEIDVTEAQQPLWDALAEALRNTASAGDAMPAMQGGMMADNGATAATPIDRIALQEKALAVRLDALRQVRVALEPFYAVLDDAQKQKANRLLAPAPMGMM